MHFSKNFRETMSISYMNCDSVCMMLFVRKYKYWVKEVMDHGLLTSLTQELLDSFIQFIRHCNLEQILIHDLLCL